MLIAPTKGTFSYVIRRLMLLSCAMPNILAAQVDSTGQIAGRVFDALTKSAVEAAVISVGEQNLNTLTDREGRFVLSNLALKTYVVSVFKQGFERKYFRLKAVEHSEISETELGLQPDRFRHRILGKVVDGITSTPLPGANVSLSGTLIGTSTDTSGEFVLTRLSQGTYTIEVSYLGYKRKVLSGITVGSEEDLALEARLEPEPIKLSEVVVSPGTFSISRYQATQLQFSKEELKLTPTGIDDPLRTLQLLPGTGSDYINAKIGIRGSRPDDALYVIDGMEIFGSIFHMDRLQGSRTAELNGLVSIVNTDIIDDLSLSLGGFPSNYGNKSGGIVDITTASPHRPGLEGSAGLSIMKMVGLVKGNYGNSSFILSAERGYFDLVFWLFGVHTNLRPNFYDLFGKYEYKLPNGRFFAELLQASDWINLTENSSSDKVMSSAVYSLNHFWSGFEYFPSPAVLSRTILYSSYLPEKSSYDVSDPAGPDFLNYEKHAVLFGIKQSIVYDISSSHSIEVGFNTKYTRSRYTFYQTYQETTSDTVGIISTEETPKGYDIGVYASYKIKPFVNDIVIDAGLRFDRQTYIGNGAQQVSPRIGITVPLPFQSTLRAGTGLYFQPADIADIYNYTSQALEVSKSTHYLVSLENRSIPLSEFRIEGYYKRLTPEITGILRYGRFAPSSYGYAYGIDVFAKKQFERWILWCGYSYAMARDRVEELAIYRTFDRRHSFSASAYLSLPGNWNLSSTFRFATGRPYTDRILQRVQTDTGTFSVVTNGIYNGSRGTNFSQLNFSIAEKTEIGWGDLTWQVEFLNVFDSQGVVTYHWSFVSDKQGGHLVENNTADLPFLMTFGVTLDF